MYARDSRAAAAGGQVALPSDAEIEVAVTALRMLADGTRLRLMWLLTTGEYDVTSLVAAVGAARPAVSQHLSKLLLAGLVTSRREGRHVHYTARGGHVRRLVTEVVHAATHQVSGQPDHDRRPGGRGRARLVRMHVPDDDGCSTGPVGDRLPDVRAGDARC